MSSRKEERFSTADKIRLAEEWDKTTKYLRDRVLNLSDIRIVCSNPLFREKL